MYVGDIMKTYFKEKKMRPRVFISSTFYDLKYIRDDLRRFLDTYNFESVLFENGDVGYVPNEFLDESCYRAMKESNIAIIIIGGRYGSPSSDDKSKKEFDKYVSVTKKEFITANNSNIPIYVFVEKNVLIEYNIYATNKEEIENKEINIKFSEAKNINVHRFIDEIYSLGNIPVTGFSIVEDITSFLTKQFADMIWDYFNIKRENLKPDLENPIESILSNVNDIKMQIDKIYGEIFKSDPEQISKLKFDRKIENVVEMISSSFVFFTKNKSKENIKNFITNLVEKLFSTSPESSVKNYFSLSSADVENFNTNFEINGFSVVEVKEQIQYCDDLFNIENDKIEDAKLKIIDKLCQPDNLKKMKIIE